MEQPEFIPLIEVVKEITVGYVGPMAGEYQEHGIPFLRSLNVKPFKFSETDLKFISPEFHKQISKSALKPGDVVAVRTGNPGASCVIPKTLPEANCSDLVVIRCSEETDPYFVSYYINSITQSIGSQSVGAIQKHFNIGSAKEIKFPKLSFDHQFKAATTLRLLDEKIALNNRICSELESLAKLLYDYWFVQFDFPMTAEQAAAHGDPTLTGKPYKSSGGKMTHNKTLNREIPEGWIGKELGEVVKITRGASPRPINDFIGDSGTPWVKIADATKTDSRFILETKQFINDGGRKGARLIESGTLILSNSATPGIPRIPMIDCGVHDGWLVIENFTCGLSREILFHYFTSERPRIFSLGSGSIFKNLKTDYVKSLGIALPPPDLFTKATKILAPINDQILTITRQNQELAALRDWLLPMLMNGQVTVNS